MKALAQSLSGGALGAVGIRGVELVAPFPTELPAGVLRTDMVWRMSDGWLFHLEFQSTRETDLHRFLEYDVRLARHHRGKIRTVVLYHTRIAQAPKELDIGTAKYRVENVHLSNQSGERALETVERHLRAGRWEPEDRLRLALAMNMDLPDRRRAFERVLELVPQVPEEERDLVAAALFALGEKGLSEDEQKRLREGLKRVSKIAQELREEGRMEGRMETARAMLAKGMDVALVSEVTGLSVEEVERLRKELQN